MAGEHIGVTPSGGTGHPRVPLLLLLLLPFAIPAATAWHAKSLSLQAGRESIHQIASDLRRENALRIQEKVTTFIEVPFRVNQANANAVELGLIDIETVLDFLPLFWRQMQQFDSLTFISVATQQGHYLDVSRSDNRLVTGFRNESTGDGTQQWAVDNPGRPTQQIGTNPGYDPRERGWYQDAVAADQPRWSEIFVTLKPKVQVLSASQPVRDRQGTLLGILSADIDTLEISRFLGSLRIGQTGQAFILERSGLLVATSANEDPFVINDPTQPPERLPAIQSQDPVTRQTTAFLQDRFTDLNQVMTTQQLDFSFEDQRYFVEVLPFADGRGVDWLIMVVIPESDFLGAIEAQHRAVALTIMAGMATALLLGILAYVWLLHPLRRLSGAASALAVGQRDRRVAVPRVTHLGPLAEAFNHMAQETEMTLQTLESKVAERTRDLQDANQQVQKLNEDLQAENLRMGAELDITRRLQQMILPREEELQDIPGLEIAGFMEPAAEVGGDYYDILHHKDQLIIGIGDVTGHGLESGVLMLMVQTAVRTLQAAQIKDPHQFIEAINQAIYGNIQRMESDKNMTLAVLDYHQGVLTLSGQHEEMILIRHNGTVERIDTLDLGFPVGLEENITAFVSQIQVEFQAGDIAVLYTDGITEAENSQGKFYGLDRLCTISQVNRHLSALELRQQIIDDVRDHIDGHQIFDDITLVVIKQK